MARPTETLPPDEAFGVLGNETRMEVLQTLGEADDPLSFSALRERVGMRDSGQFNYHLDKVVGHFVERTDEGYDLMRAGERVIEAVLSGAVTETPILDPTTVDWPCHRCGASLTVSYQQGWVALSCTECPGGYRHSHVEDEPAPDEQLERGYIGGLSLPPAAVQGRTPSEVVQAAWNWDALERLAAASGTCPRCSAPIERSVDVCQDHEADDSPCEACGSHRMLNHETACTNCPYGRQGSLPNAFLSNTDLLAFFTAHGYNPITPSVDYIRKITDRKEELLTLDPFEAQFTWTIGGDSLTITVNADLEVVNVEEKRAAETR